MSDADEWRSAYAAQAKADFETWDQLQHHRGVPLCHKLHFLQMACEKLAKAHLCAKGSDPRQIQASHAYFAKSLPKIAEYHYARMGRSRGKYTSVFKKMGNLAREIELLSPSVDDNGHRPDNCEYPWELPDGKLRIPATYAFPNLNSLNQPVGFSLLKVVQKAILHLVGS